MRRQPPPGKGVDDGLLINFGPSVEVKRKFKTGNQGRTESRHPRYAGIEGPERENRKRTDSYNSWA